MITATTPTTPLSKIEAFISSDTLAPMSPPLREDFEDLSVAIEELLWDMQRLDQLDQDIDDDGEATTTTAVSGSQDI
ncbi:hypothetical protein Aduo_013405 [Ancylostoma duodenale]